MENETQQIQPEPVTIPEVKRVLKLGLLQDEILTLSRMSPGGKAYKEKVRAMFEQAVFLEYGLGRLKDKCNRQRSAITVLFTVVVLEALYILRVSVG